MVDSCEEEVVVSNELIILRATKKVELESPLLR